MSQELLPFGAGSKVATWSEDLLELMREIVGLISLKEFAWQCGAEPSQINEALRGKSGKYFRVEWFLALLEIAPDAHRERLLIHVAGPVGYGVKRKRELTPEEELAQLKRHLHREAPGALKSFERERSV